MVEFGVFEGILGTCIIFAELTIRELVCLTQFWACMNSRVETGVGVLFLADGVMNCTDLSFEVSFRVCGAGAEWHKTRASRMKDCLARE